MPQDAGLPHTVETDKNDRFYGWVFWRHPNGQWVSLRKATAQELAYATQKGDEE